MRRSLVAALLIASLAAAAGCAHPQNLAPKPGETTTTTRATPPRTSTSTASGEDETEQVCTEAQSVSDDAEAELTEKLDEAQGAMSAGNTAVALAAATEAKSIAQDWKSELEDLADRPIDADVRSTLEDGIDTIDTILNTDPRQLNPDEAREDVEGFLDDLERVCA